MSWRREHKRHVGQCLRRRRQRDQIMKTLLFIYLFTVNETKMNIFNDKRYSSQRPLHTLTTRKQRYIEQKSINIREKKNMYNFTETS